MPTVLRIDNFVFYIWYGDHEPPHVHVFRGGEEIVIKLGDERTAPELRETYATRARSRRALEIAYENQGALLARWSEING